MATGDGTAAELEDPAEEGAVAEMGGAAPGGVAELSHPASASAASTITGTAQPAVIRAIDLDPFVAFGLAID